MSMIRLPAALACLGVLGALLTSAAPALANEVVSAGPGSGAATAVLSSAARASAQSRTPMLTDPSQLPAEVRQLLGVDGGDVTPLGYGTANHPFTTKRAVPNTGTLFSVRQFPYSASGKLWMRFGSSTFVCSASVIEKGVLVTAAHCVWNYGGRAADSVWFEPARNGSQTPFGAWTASTWIVPAVYDSGTDVCTVSGIVCENDIAVVIVEPDSSGQFVSEAVGGKYSWRYNNYGYTSFAGLQAGQITAMGYPVAFDSGMRMIRTDSLGYHATPSNVIIGTDQTGGSSGGPWMMNFGMPPVSSSSAPSANQSNTVMATTSWGYVSSTIKVQGASRFARNTTFTTSSNIEALVDFACSNYPTHC